MAARRRARGSKPRFRSNLPFDSREALVEHRELEFLREAGSSRRRGHTARVRHRARKLDTAKTDFRDLRDEDR